MCSCKTHDTASDSVTHGCEFVLGNKLAVGTTKLKRTARHMPPTAATENSAGKKAINT